MKALFYFLPSLLFLPLEAHCLDSKGDDWESSCKSSSEMAFNVMRGRQAGIPMSKMMEIADNSGDQDITNVARKMVMDAYEISRYNTDGMRNGAIADFRDKYYLSCAKYMMSKSDGKQLKNDSNFINRDH